MRYGLVVLLMFGLLLAGCGGGGSTGTGADTDLSTATSGTTTTPTTLLTGTVATGAPAAQAQLQIRDARGRTVTTTTGNDGTYSANIGGMDPPMLICATWQNRSMYGIAFGSGTANVTPYSHAVMAAWCECMQTSVQSMFGSPSSSRMPSQTSVRLAVRAMVRQMSTHMEAHGLGMGFDPLTSGFQANHSGFDAVLDETTMTSDTCLQASTGNIRTTATLGGSRDADGYALTLQAQVRHGGTGALCNTVCATRVCTFGTGSIDDVTDGVNALLESLAATINARGASLQASDLVALLPSDFLDQGQDATTFAESLVAMLGGSTVTGVRVVSVDSYDASTHTAMVTVIFDTAERALTFQMSYQFRNGNHWAWHGDRRPAPNRACLAFQNARTIDNTSDSGFVPQVLVDLLAPRGLVSTVTVDDPTTAFFPTPATVVPKLSQVDVTNPLRLRDEFRLAGTSTSQPPAGTLFSLVVSPATGPSVTGSHRVMTTTTDTLANYALTVGGVAVPHALGSVAGQDVSLAWSLPTTFTPACVTVTVVTRSASASRIDVVRVPQARATAGVHVPGTVVNPLTSTTDAVTEVTIIVRTLGPHGEDIAVYDTYQ